MKEIEKEWDPALLQANTTILEGQSLSPKELVEACQIVPFFSPKRLVLVFNLLQRFEPKKEQPIDEKEVERFASALKEIPQTTILVLIEEKISEGNPLFNMIKSGAQVKSFPLLKGEQLHNWIRRRVTSKGGSISPEAVTLLAEIGGENLWNLANEIEKLLLFTQGKTIKEKDVYELVSSAYEITIFRLIDALLQGKAPEAGRWLHYLLLKGVKPPYILVMLSRQLRLIVQTKELLSQRVPLPEIRNRLGISGYALDQTLNQAKGYTFERIKEVYHRILETDLAIKTGRREEELALDLLLIELSRI